MNLSSFNLCFSATVSGATPDAGNGFTQSKLPHGHKLFSSVRVYVGGQLVSGSLSTHYDILYNALCKASASEDWCRSRYNEHTKELIENGDDMSIFGQNVNGTLGGAQSKTARYVMTDFLGLFRANGGKSIIDTSLWGDIDIELTFNSAACIAKRNGSGIANAATAPVNITYSVSGIEAFVECITQTSPLYIKVISMIIDGKQDLIRFPYQNFITGTTNTGKSARLQINSGCIDAMVICPLGANFNSLTAPVQVGDLSAPRYKYTAIKTDGSAAAALTDVTNIQIQIGSDTFPKVPIQHNMDVVDITTNSLFSNSLYSQNLLFNGLAANNNGAAVSAAYDAFPVSYYSRASFLKENFVYIQSFSDQEGWSRDAAGADGGGMSYE